MSALHLVVGLLALYLAAYSSTAQAGAWTQPPNGLYVKASFDFSSADEQIKCCIDERRPLLSETDRGDVHEGAIRFYGEYGLPLPIPGGLTVIVQTAYVFAEIDSQRALRNTRGFSDIRLGLRWGLPIQAIQPVVLSVQVEGKLPTGYTANLPDGAQLPWLGNGVFELTSSLLAGVSFYPVPIYLTGGVGFRWRGSDENRFSTIDYANELPYSLELGGTIANRVLIHFLLDGVAPLGDLDELNIAALTPPASRVLRLGGGIIVTVWQGLQVSFDYMRTIDGVNVVLANQFIAGVAWTQ